MVHNQIEIGFLILSSVTDGITVHPKGKVDQIVKPILFERSMGISSVLINTIYDETGVANYLELSTFLRNNVSINGMITPIPDTRKRSFLFSRSEINDYEAGGILTKIHEFILPVFQNPNPGFGGTWTGPSSGSNNQQNGFSNNGW